MCLPVFVLVGDLEQLSENGMIHLQKIPQGVERRVLIGDNRHQLVHDDGNTWQISLQRIYDDFVFCVSF